ncbi:MAG: PilZ domain-containing protein [Thermodesulfobacteriota bacterium]
MQKLWSDDPEIIEGELEQLVARQAPLTLYRRGEEQHRLSPADITPQKNFKLLTLRKEGEFAAPSEPCLFLYQSTGNGMRCFQATVLVETRTELGVPLPQAIHAIHQYRKHRRYQTSTRSTVTFTRPGGRVVNHGVVQNVSKEGAKLLGKFSHHIKVGDQLSPLTMTLRLRFGDHAEWVTASVATVRRIIEVDEEHREFGVEFQLSPTEQANLEIYLTILTLEQPSPR